MEIEEIFREKNDPTKQTAVPLLSIYLFLPSQAAATIKIGRFVQSPSFQPVAAIF